MSAERNQQLRLLESEYLKLRWKIRRYERCLDILLIGAGEIKRNKVKARLENFRKTQGELWEQLVEFHKDS